MVSPIDTALGFLMVLLRCFAMLCVIAPLRIVLGLPILAVVSMAIACPVYAAVERSLVLGLEQASGAALLAIAALQIFQGALAGIPCALVFECLPMMGRLFDASRGAQFAEQVCPDSGESVSPLENLGQQLGVLFFFSIGGLPMLAAIVRVNLDCAKRAERWTALDAGHVLEMSGRIIEQSLLLGGSVLIVCLLFDFVYAVVCRSLGRLNLFFDALAVKLILGILVFWSCADGFREVFIGLMRKAINLVV